MPTKIKDNTKADGRDLFQTPHYATRLLLPFLKPYTTVWEPAVGAGRMLEVLETQHAVWGSDVSVPDPETLHPGDYEFEKWDFLERTKNDVWMQQIQYIVTNPPFSKKLKFYQKCMYYYRQCGTPFALLIPADYSGWLIKAVRDDGCVKLIPTKRINYITPSGLDEKGGHTANFHSMWLTQGIPLRGDWDIFKPTEVYMELTKEMQEDV